MKKIFAGVLAVLLLTGCQNAEKKENSTNAIFKEELAIASKIGEATGKVLSEELIIENIETIFDGIFDLAIFESSNVEYGEITQGTGSDGKGGRVFCCKLPATVEFVGSEASVEKFVEYFNDVDCSVSFGEFNITPLEDEKYEVNTLINFMGKAVSGSLSEGKSGYTIKRNEVEVESKDETTLREFDIAMIIRPSNSDSSSVSLSVGDDKANNLYSDDNEKKDVYVTLSSESGTYYCEYKIDDGEYKKAKIKPGRDILFDILSCEVIESEDKISTDLHITNNSEKKVSVFIYDDDDSRVRVADKTGSVEVKNK